MTWNHPYAPRFIVVDLFCGAGGVTEGLKRVRDEQGRYVYYIAAAVNHDAAAIATHSRRHSETYHFTEDVRDPAVIGQIATLIDALRVLYPDAYVLLHASLECTNFSNAKGGKPRDADSRSLADHMPDYLTALRPDYFTVENVVEFMAWGPLDEAGKPLSRKRGLDYLRWCGLVEDMGYRYHAKVMNAADYGARTSRKRLFLCFNRPGTPFGWPEQTHSKGGKVPGTLPWQPVRPLLDLADRGESIFLPRPKSGKLLSEATFKRIHAGLQKFCRREVFLTQLCASNSQGWNSYPADGPSRTVTTQDGTAVVAPVFVDRGQFGHDPASLEAPSHTLTASHHRPSLASAAFLSQNVFANEPQGLDNPARTLLTGSHYNLVQPYLMQSHGGVPSGKVSSAAAPARTVKASPNEALVQADFLVSQFTGEQVYATDGPAGTVTTSSGSSLATAAFAAGYYSTGDNCSSVDAPVGTITTKDKVALVQAEAGRQKPHTGQGHWFGKCAEFCRANGIADVYMRMLTVRELARIQGFGDDYPFAGSQQTIKKHIGNAVEVTQSEAIGRALWQAAGRMRGKQTESVWCSSAVCRFIEEPSLFNHS